MIVWRLESPKPNVQFPSVHKRHMVFLEYLELFFGDIRRILRTSIDNWDIPLWQVATILGPLPSISKSTNARRTTALPPGTGERWNLQQCAFQCRGDGTCSYSTKKKREVEKSSAHSPTVRASDWYGFHTWRNHLLDQPHKNAVQLGDSPSRPSKQSPKNIDSFESTGIHSAAGTRKGNGGQARRQAHGKAHFAFDESLTVNFLTLEGGYQHRAAAVDVGQSSTFSYWCSSFLQVVSIHPSFHQHNAIEYMDDLIEWWAHWWLPISESGLLSAIESGPHCDMRNVWAWLNQLIGMSQIIKAWLNCHFIECPIKNSIRNLISRAHRAAWKTTHKPLIKVLIGFWDQHFNQQSIGYVALNCLWWRHTTEFVVLIQWLIKVLICLLATTTSC